MRKKIKNIVLLIISVLISIYGIVLCVMHETMGISVFVFGTIYIMSKQKNKRNKILILVLSCIFILVAHFYII